MADIHSIREGDTVRIVSEGVYTATPPISSYNKYDEDVIVVPTREIVSIEVVGSATKKLKGTKKAALKAELAEVIADYADLALKYEAVIRGRDFWRHMYEGKKEQHSELDEQYAALLDEHYANLRTIRALEGALGGVVYINA